MKRAMLAVAVLAALAAGQYIEKYIPLPDSFGSINVYDDSCWFVEDVASGRVFYGVEDRRFLLVLAPATGQRIGRVELGGYLYGPIGYNPDAHKLYCTAGDRYITACSLLVLDCASGARRAAIPTGVGHALGFCHSTATGKVYVLLSNRSVLVVDGRSDSLLTLITPRPPVWSPMAYSPVSNKLYIPGLDTLLVFDGAGDTLLRKVYLGADWETGPMTWNPNANTVWCVLAEEESLLVIDCATDSVVAAVRQFSGGETHAVVCDTANRRVYCSSNGGELLVLDAMTATVDTVLDDWHHYPRRLAVSPALGKLYVVDDMELRILDDSSFAVLNEFLIDPAGIGVVAGGSRVFSVYYGRLYVVDGAGDSIMTEAALSWNVTPLCFNPADGRVYGTEWYQSQLVAIDGAAAAVADVWDVPWDLRPEVAVCCSLTSRLFFESDLSAGVFDCPAESIVEFPAGLLRLVCHDDVRHRVYYRGRDNDLVGIDCRTLEEASRVRLQFPASSAVEDGQRGRLYLMGMGPWLFAAYDVVDDSVVWVSSGTNPGAMALDTRDNLLFVSGQGSLLVLDCADGSIDTTISGMTGSPVELVYDKNLNRVYARSSDNNVNIIDCASRSVVQTVYLGFVARDLVLDQTRERLYVHSFETYPAPPTCAVVDGRTGNVLARLGLDYRWFDEYNRPVFDWRHGRLYGASGNEGGITVIRDTTPIGIAERSLTPSASRITPAATVVRGVLHVRPSPFPLPEGEGQRVRGQSVLLDVTGRKVMDLKGGDNDVSRLAPGIYFVRQASSVRREASSVTKVVITR